MGDSRAGKILRSEIEPPEVSQVDLYSFVIREWNDWLDEVVLVNTGTRHEYTFRQALEIMERTVGEMSRVGLRCGDVVSVWCSNNVEMLFASMAAWKLGAATAMIPASLTAGEAARSINKVRSIFAFVSENNKSKLLKEFPASEKLFSLGNCDFVSLSRRGNTPSAAVSRKTSLDETCIILFSSGTTGLPKAVELTHRNMVTSLELTSARYTGRKVPIALVFQPMSHFYGIASALKLMNDGAKTLIMPRFDLEEYLRLISEHRLMSMALVPPVAVMITNHPELLKKYDLSSVFIIFSSGAPLPIETEKKLKELLPETLMLVAQGYGLTETTGGITRTSENSPAGSVGCVMPLLEVKIADVESSRICGQFERGELLVRGPTVMKGYFDDPKATAEMFDSDGWLRTGDIAYYDENETIFIVDRIKELIKHKGQQVAPAELENVLLSHGEVKDAAVVGIPDLTMGELPTAFIVKSEGSRTTEKQLQDYVAERVAPYKQLTGGVKFVSSIPKSPNGKILRRLLRDSLTKKSRL